METTQSWSSFKSHNPKFAGVFLKAYEQLCKLLGGVGDPNQSSAGQVIWKLLYSSMHDFDDILTLSSHDSHWGAAKLLRSLYERTVVLKYIYLNQAEAEAFSDFDAFDWKNVLEAIDKLSGIKAKPETLASIQAQVLQNQSKYKQEKCVTCGSKKRTTWTPYGAEELAKRAGLSYLFYFGFILPSKLLHPTLFGANEIMNENAPLYNTLNGTHSLLVESLLVYQRMFTCFNESEIPSYVEEYLDVWTISQTDFGLPLRRA